MPIGGYRLATVAPRQPASGSPRHHAPWRRASRMPRLDSFWRNAGVDDAVYDRRGLRIRQAAFQPVAHFNPIRRQSRQYSAAPVSAFGSPNTPVRPRSTADSSMLRPCKSGHRDHHYLLTRGLLVAWPHRGSFALRLWLKHFCLVNLPVPSTREAQLLCDRLACQQQATKHTLASEVARAYLHSKLTARCLIASSVLASSFSAIGIVAATKFTLLPEGPGNVCESRVVPACTEGNVIPRTGHRDAVLVPSSCGLCPRLEILISDFRSG